MPPTDGPVGFQDLADARTEDRKERSNQLRWVIGLFVIVGLTLGTAVVTDAIAGKVADAIHDQDIEANREKAIENREAIQAVQKTVEDRHIETIEKMSEGFRRVEATIRER